VRNIGRPGVAATAISAVDPAGGAMSPDLDRPGHGLALRAADTERYRHN
jgi:hypothetical protein